MNIFSSQSQIDFLIIHFMKKEVRTMLPNGRLKLTSQLIDRMLLLFKTQLESRHMPKANWDWYENTCLTVFGPIHNPLELIGLQFN